MEKSKLTEAQIAFILRQSKEDTAIGDILRKAGISAATYGDLMPSEVADLSQYRERLQGKRRNI